MARTRTPPTRPPPYRDAKLFYIVCGGQETEVLYFDLIKHEIHSSKLSILAIPPKDNKCDPKNLIERAKEKILDPDDEYWVVFDIDHNLQDNHIANLTEAMALANQSNPNIRMAISNPCFEVWLIFHSDHNLKVGIPTTSYENEARTAFRSYKKNNLENIPLNKRNFRKLWIA